MGQFSRVASSNLNSARLDAEYYGTAYVENAKRIASFGNVSTLEEMRKRLVPIRRGIDMPNFVDDETSPLMVTIAAFEDPGINFKGLQRVSKNQHHAFNGSHIKAGDLLVAMGGYAGKAAICPPDTPESNIGRHTARIVVDETKADVYYVWAFIRSAIGTLQFDRYITGSVQAGINLEDIRDISIATPSELAQKYIGDKVRQAERLRTWAKELRSSVDKVLDQLSLPTFELPATVNRVSIERLEARLDPRPYRTHYINLVDRIKAVKHSCVSDVAELASGCPVSSNDFVEGGEVPLVRIRNIGFDEFIELDTGVTKALHKDEAKYQAKENMIVLGMDGIFRAQFFLSDELPMLVNQRVGMLTANDIRAELLTHWLNRSEGQMQLNQWAVKTTVEHTSLSDIGRVRIPRLDTNIEDGLADKLLSARRAYRYSRFLTICAKLLVEALIEGQLTEAELIAAEQALQAGNDQFDRRILNRLKTDGIDGQGAALFADLDEIYRLLAQAEVD